MEDVFPSIAKYDIHFAHANLVAKLSVETLLHSK